MEMTFHFCSSNSNPLIIGCNELLGINLVNECKNEMRPLPPEPLKSSEVLL